MSAYIEEVIAEIISARAALNSASLALAARQDRLAKLCGDDCIATHYQTLDVLTTWVALLYNLTPKIVRSPTRNALPVEARFLVIHLACKRLRIPGARVARWMHRDEGSIANALRRVRDWAESDSQFAAKLESDWQLFSKYLETKVTQ